MNKYGYVSGMADEMTLYIDYKVRSGFMEKSYTQTSQFQNELKHCFI